MCVHLRGILSSIYGRSSKDLLLTTATDSMELLWSKQDRLLENYFSDKAFLEAHQPNRRAPQSLRVELNKRIVCYCVNLCFACLFVGLMFFFSRAKAPEVSFDGIQEGSYNTKYWLFPVSLYLSYIMTSVTIYHGLGRSYVRLRMKQMRLIYLSNMGKTREEEKKKCTEPTW